MAKNITEMYIGTFHIKGNAIEDFAGILRNNGYRTVVYTPYSEGENYHDITRIVEVFEKKHENERACEYGFKF